MASNHEGLFKKDDIQEICSKLIFISKVQPGQKISVEGQYIQDNTILTSLSRTISYYTSGESRDKVYQFLTDVIQDAFSILESLGDSSNEFQIQICKNLVKHLLNMKHGLNNLKETYQSDQKYVSKIQVLIQNLDVKVQELCKKKSFNYPGLVLEADQERERPDSPEAVSDQSSDGEATKPPATPASSPTTPASPETEAVQASSATQASPETETAQPDSQESKKSYAEAVHTETQKEKSEGRTKSGDPQLTSGRKGRRKKKTSYEYNSYYPHYMSNPDDLYMYQADSDVGVIKK